MNRSILYALLLSTLALGLFPGCRAYRVKKAEFMRDDARAISDSAERARALVDADCYVEYDRIPPTDPRMVACRKDKGPARIEEVLRSAKPEERPILKAWAACMKSYSGSGDAWSECRQEAESAVPIAPPSGEPAGPVHTSTTGSSTTSM